MPPKSQCWRYFEEINVTSVKCRSCGKICKTAGNTTNLKCHLDKKHPNLMPKYEPMRTTPSSTPAIFKEPSVVPSTSTTTVTLEMSESGSDCESEKSYSPDQL